VPGLLRGVARTAAIAGTATAVSGRVQRRQNRRWAEQDYQGPVEAPPPAPPPVAAQAAPSGGADRLEQLTQLGELKAQGVLTEEEFAREKARILAG
jgi:hypothetical protein